MVQHTKHTYEELLEAIDDKMYMIQATWKIYRQLFGTTKERVDLLNTWVPSFTGILQRVLVDSVILGICRLCDPPGKHPNKNLTLQRVVDALDPRPNVANSAFFKTQLDKVADLAKAARKHRHKRLAHSDLKSARAEQDMLPDVSRQTIEDVLRAIRELLNAINLHYRNGEFAYENVPLPGDGEFLIKCIQMAARMCELQDESWGGKVSDEQLIQKLRNRMLERI